MNKISEFAIEALIEEVSLDFKPGLVCQNSNGSHHDMTHETFMLSIESFRPHFVAYETIGKTHTGSEEELFTKLRQQGILAEKDMFNATNGINTHKGANFILSLLIGAISYLLNQNQSLKELPKTLQKMTQSLDQDLKHINEKKELTHGERIFLNTKRMGIREEAMKGFPILFDYPFSYIDGSNESKHRFLFGSMEHLFDTTIVHRRGIDGLMWTQEIAKTLNPKTIEVEFNEINNEFIKRWISPGGSADFLSAAILVHKVLQYVKEE